MPKLPHGRQTKSGKKGSRMVIDRKKSLTREMKAYSGINVALYPMWVAQQGPVSNPITMAKMEAAMKEWIG